MSAPHPISALHSAASRKAAVRLVPLLCLVYFMAFIDRTNVAIAKSALETDVGISVAAYGLGAGIFFLSYAFLEVPSNLLMHRFGPKVWITRIAITWGALTASMAFVQGETSFYVIRFLLGMAEAGLFPALMYIVTVWFAQHQRSTIVGLLYVAVCLGLALGGPIGGALIQYGGTASVTGWQFMFLAEGGFTILVGLMVLRLLPNRPGEAAWLTAAEARELEAAAVPPGAPQHTTLRGNVKVAFGRPFIIALALVYFANQVTSVSVQYNFPSIVEALDVPGTFLVGLVSGSVGISALVGVLVIPAMHRRVGSELRVITGCSVGVAAAAISYAFVDGPVVRIVLINVAMMFLIGTLPIYWSVATARMSGLMAAAGLAFINTIGLVGGFVGPYLYGWAEAASGPDLSAFVVLTGASVLGLLLIPLLRLALRAEGEAPVAHADGTQDQAVREPQATR